MLEFQAVLKRSAAGAVNTFRTPNPHHPKEMNMGCLKSILPHRVAV